MTTSFKYGPTAAGDAHSTSNESRSLHRLGEKSKVSSNTSPVTSQSINQSGGDTRVRLTGCNNSPGTVAFPDGLNMTILWGPAAHKVIAKWDDQGLSQRRVYGYSCAVGV
jgi:hypothetical protein